MADLLKCSPLIMLYLGSIGIDIGLDKQKIERKIVNIFLPISLNMWFGCSKELSHLDGSFEHFWSRNKKIIFLVRTLY